MDKEIENLDGILNKDFEEDFFEPNYMELNKHDYKVGDVYKQMTIDYYEYINDGNDGDKYPFNKYLELIVEYITPENGIILKSKDGITDSTFDFSSFKGREIKVFYPDFTGNDDEYYYVLCYEGNPFF